MTVRKRDYKDKHEQQIWGYDFFYEGIRYRKAGFTTKAEAEIAETRAKDKAYKGIAIIRTGAFNSLMESFINSRESTKAESTVNNDRGRLNYLSKHFGEMKTALITPSNIEVYRDLRHKEGKKPRTINLELNLLSSFFEYAIRHHFASDNPAREVEKIPVDTNLFKEIPTIEEFWKLVDNAKKTETGNQLACWILVRGYTGCRPGESFYLEWKDIDFEKNQIKFFPKTGSHLKDRESKAVPLHSKLKPYLLEWKKEWRDLFKGKPPHDWVFVHPRYPLRRAKDFPKAFERAKLLSGITKNITPHSFRHFFITNCIQLRIDRKVIADWVGHSSTRMIDQVYTHLSSSFYTEEMNKFDITPKKT